MRYEIFDKWCANWSICFSDEYLCHHTTYFDSALLVAYWITFLGTACLSGTILGQLRLRQRRDHFLVAVNSIVSDTFSESKHTSCKIKTGGVSNSIVQYFQRFDPSLTILYKTNTSIVILLYETVATFSVSDTKTAQVSRPLYTKCCYLSVINSHTCLSKWCLRQSCAGISDSSTSFSKSSCVRESLFWMNNEESQYIHRWNDLSVEPRLKTMVAVLPARDQTQYFSLTNLPACCKDLSAARHTRFRASGDQQFNRTTSRRSCLCYT